MMPMRLSKKFAVLSLLLAAAIWMVYPVFAAPPQDGGPAATETPTNTPEPTATQESEPTQTPEATEPPNQDGEDSGDPDVRPDEDPTEVPPDSGGANDTTSILGFLLCVGVIIVMGLLALNFWPKRRP